MASLPKNKAYPKELRTLGEHIRKVRLDRKLHQSDVAQIIGVDTLSITNWEIGRSKPQIRFYPSIIKFLNFDPRPKFDNFGEELRHARESLGVSIKRLATLVDMDEATISNIEANKCSTKELLLKLQCYLSKLRTPFNTSNKI